MKKRGLPNYFVLSFVFLNLGVICFGQETTTSQWKIYDDKGIFFQYPAIFSVVEFIDKTTKLRPRVFRLSIECSLWSTFRIELYKNMSIDKILGNHQIEINPPSFQQWLVNSGFSNEVVQVGGREAFKVRMGGSGTTQIFSNGLFIVYDGPMGCTSNPEITDDFEKIVASIKFHESKK